MIISEVHFKTGVDLDMAIEGASYIAALPKGQAVVHHTDYAMIINGLGQVIKRFYTGSEVAGFQVPGSESIILYYFNGTVIEMQSQDGRILNVFETGIERITNRANSYTDKCNIPKDTILFVQNAMVSPVFSYNVSSQTRKLNVEGLHGAYSVSSGCVNGSVVYIVPEVRTHKVHVYNASWSHIASFGGWGSQNGQLKDPYSAVISDRGYIYVANFDNYHVSMFTSDGQFVKHILTYEYPYKPWLLSVRGRYLWVTSHAGPDPVRRVIRYILF